MAPKAGLYNRLSKIFWTAIDKGVEDPSQELVILSALSLQNSLIQIKNRIDENRAVLESGSLGCESRIYVVLDGLTILTLISVKNPSIIPTFVQIGITKDITEYCLAKLKTFQSGSSVLSNIPEDQQVTLQPKPLNNESKELNANERIPGKWTSQTDYRLAYLLLSLVCEFSQNHVQDPTLDRSKITDGLLVFLHNDSDPLNPRCKDLIKRSLIILESNLEVFNSIHVLRLTDFVSSLLEMLIGINGNIAELIDQDLKFSRKSSQSLSSPSFSSFLVSDSAHKDRLSNLPFYSKQSFEHFADNLLSYIDHALVLICSLASSGGFDQNAIESQADAAIFGISITCLSHSKLLNSSSLVKALFTISSICAADPSKRDMLTASIPTILKFTKFFASDREEEEKIIVSAVEAIWQGVVGHSANETFFFEHDGVGLLLDCLRRSSFYIKRHVIGCMLDLLSNAKASYFLQVNFDFNYFTIGH